MDLCYAKTFLIKSILIILSVSFSLNLYIKKVISASNISFEGFVKLDGQQNTHKIFLKFVEYGLFSNILALNNENAPIYFSFYI